MVCARFVASPLVQAKVNISFLPRSGFPPEMNLRGDIKKKYLNLKKIAPR
jgi:hypothetical protein